MTHDEMRRQLAWAQGWTEITTGSDGDLYGSPPGTADPDEWDTVPNPLDDDYDAALLRAWCLERGWNMVLNYYPDVAVVSIYSADDEFLAQAWVGATADFADLSTIQRERLAMGRAVARAIEAAEEI
jgi:hypothetical protein